MQTGTIQADMQLGDRGGGPTPPAAPQWHVLWTPSNGEQVVQAQPRAKGYELLLSLVGAWNRRRGMRFWSAMPLFPGYLFLRHAMDQYSYLEVGKVRGLARLLGVRWDRLAVVPDRQIESVRRVLQSDSPARRHGYLCEGQLVRIADGPLVNIEGRLLRTDRRKGLLVVSIELLKRSVAVEVDCSLIVAA
jgi:transcription antitermination factor NusG